MSSNADNLEVALGPLRVIDHWTANGSPYSDTLERLADHNEFFEAARTIGGLLVDSASDYYYPAQLRKVPALSNFRQLGFESAGHGLWFAVDHEVKRLTKGGAFLGEVVTPESFERTEVPAPILAALVSDAARQEPLDYPGFALAISKIASPHEPIPVYQKVRLD